MAVPRSYGALGRGFCSERPLGAPDCVYLESLLDAFITPDCVYLGSFTGCFHHLQRSCTASMAELDSVSGCLVKRQRNCRMSLGGERTCEKEGVHPCRGRCLEKKRLVPSLGPGSPRCRCATGSTLRGRGDRNRQDQGQGGDRHS